MTTSDQVVPEPTAEQPAPLPPVQPTAFTGYPGPNPAPVSTAAAAAQTEYVGRGLLFALGAVPAGMLAAVVLWKLGFVGSISSFVVAAGAVFLYTKGALRTPRKGLAPLVAVVLLGVVASFFAVVAADIVEYYGTPAGQELGFPSAFEMVRANLFNGALLKTYGSDIAMFAVFGALGVFGTLRRLLAARHA